MTAPRARRAGAGVRRVPRIDRAARAVREAPRRPAPVPPALRQVARREGGADPRARAARPARPARSSSATAPGSTVESRPTRSRSSSGTGCAYVSVDAPATRASNVSRACRRRTHPVAPTSASTAATGRRGTSSGGKSSERFDWMSRPRSSPSGSRRSGGWPTTRRRSTPSSTTTGMTLPLAAP